VVDAGISVITMAPGFDGNLYISDGDSIYQFDPAQGGSRQVGGLLFLYNPLIKSDPTGKRLFIMERGLSGGGEMLEEFTIVGGDTGIERATTHFNGKANDKDFELDLQNDAIYATAGGVYGINVWK